MSLVMDELNKQYDFIKTQYPEENIVGIFLCGSQNYGTDLPDSDVDSKVLLAPTLNDIYQNKKGDNTTRIFPGTNEQIAVKDVRSAFSEIKKQNINMLEILFTDYCIINPAYRNIWTELTAQKEKIARYNPYLAVKTTKGISFEFYNKLYKEDGTVNRKMASNLIRVDNYLKNYIDKKPYKECLQPKDEVFNYIMQIRTGEMGEHSAQIFADAAFANIKILADTYCEKEGEKGNIETEELLNKACKDIIDTAFFAEYARNGEI